LRTDIGQDKTYVQLAEHFSFPFAMTKTTQQKKSFRAWDWGGKLTTFHRNPYQPMWNGVDWSAAKQAFTYIHASKKKYNTVPQCKLTMRTIALEQLIITENINVIDTKRHSYILYVYIF